MRDEILPNELWLEIFQWATSTLSKGTYPHALSYAPFQSLPVDSGDIGLKIKSALVRVCRRWRSLTTELLYSDVRIKQGQNALRRALEDIDHEGYRRLVRCAILPYQSTATSTWSPSPLTSVEILRLCDELQVLIRPRVSQSPRDKPLRFEFDADCPPLPSLKRLEWWHNEAAERTGGINSLAAVLCNAPNVKYLFIGGVTGINYSTSSTVAIHLPHLETLRLHAINAVLMRQISCHWTMPSLTHVIIDYPLITTGLQSLWDTVGPQLQVVEFGKHLRFFTADFITPCLQGCPNLQEFNYCIMFTAIPTSPISHPSLTSVGMNFAKNQLLDTESGMWTLIEDHFIEFICETFPNLLSLRIFEDEPFGEWDDIVAHPRFSLLEELLRERGCSTELITHY